MFTTSHGQRGIRVPHVPRFGPRPSPLGPRPSPPRSPAPPPPVPFDSPDGPTGFPHGATAYRPDRRCRGPPKGNDKGRTEKDHHQWRGGPGRPAVAAFARMTQDGQRRHGWRRRGDAGPRATKAGPAPSPFATLVPPTSHFRCVGARSHADRPRRRPAAKRSTRRCAPGTRRSRAATAPLRNGNPGGPSSLDAESPRIPTWVPWLRPLRAPRAARRWRFGSRGCVWCAKRCVRAVASSARSVPHRSRSVARAPIRSEGRARSPPPGGRPPMAAAATRRRRETRGGARAMRVQHGSA
jgi:hypothetical protein